MCKGADSIIIPRLSKKGNKFIKITDEHLEGYAEEGLRTLLVVEKEIDDKFYESWNKQYQEAQSSPNRESEMDRVSELLETDF
jgi:magnesium-transporting ATPase (P-type)